MKERLANPFLSLCSAIAAAVFVYKGSRATGAGLSVNVAQIEKRELESLDFACVP